MQTNHPNSSEFSAFIEGYGYPENHVLELQSELYILLLLRALDKVRWAIDRYPAGIPDLSKFAKRVVNIVTEGEKDLNPLFTQR
jgi:hypothetical protein